MSKRRLTAEAEVLIAGAGPVGLMLAVGLAQLGVAIRIVDRDLQPKREPRAGVVWPREAEAMAMLGLGPRLRAAALPLLATEVIVNGRERGTLRFGSLDSAFPHPLVIEQHHTAALLTERLSELGVQVERGSELTAFTAGEGRVAATLTHTEGRVEAARFGWLVGCDGARSGVRKALGLAFKGRAVRGLEVVQVNAKPRNLRAFAPGIGAFFVAPHHALGSFEVPGGRRRFYCFKTIEEPDRTSPPTVDEMRAMIARVAHAPGLELDGVDWLNRARFQERIAARFRAGRVLLAGDAAHIWAAVGGHGMNVGLLGAFNLAWKLAAVVRGEAPDALLDTYEIEQRAHVRTVIGHTRVDLLERPMPAWGVSAMSAVLPAALTVGTVQRQVERALSDTALHHRRSPLSRRAGERLGASQPVLGGRSVEDAIGFDRWTLFAPERGPIEALARVVASVRTRIELLRTHGSDELRLVRPDGYTGLRAAESDVGALSRYLDAHFVRA